MTRKFSKGANVNPYHPVEGRIIDIVRETEDVSLYRLKPAEKINYRPGQFFMVGLWGAGEVPISVSSLEQPAGIIELSIRKVGKVTGAIHALTPGDSLWIRGPYGNGFPLEPAKGRDVVLIAGGIGMAPLRPLVHYFVREPGFANQVTLLYGARTPQDMVFTEELDSWAEGGIKVVRTVDRCGLDWKCYVGVVTELWHEVHTEFQNASAYICGPEVMIKAATRDLFFFGMPDDRIVTTLEAHMKCGVGKCGHCYSAEKYLCTDGPVFTYRELREHPNIF